ncbi:sulfate adenylyltransferase subunit CysN [Rhizobium sp. L51/94]|uniref:sulfate adenylyltransferase subunit CysN n=1 Tax=Rhizobium sp. L51/94 TaxID=2819999 RepID=UPI001C5ABC24|nr:sulfate adenylyltransferase subunit CysN [Rhizobium sp. L51/94]QXZ81379.1 sulfate adenylyltransferase subunit CysN [Rhizobium sp. L51/94]
MDITRSEKAANLDFVLDQEGRSLLRFITCGSVDDGKSTLIGRLLYDANMIFDDQLTGLESDSVRYGTVGDDVDFALLLDGLEAEREQGITIDVAYRFFSTNKRRFVVADTPGHEEYTRNMVTGASTADLAVVLVDARRGVLQQTRRHTYICSLLGIRHMVLAVNKIDLVDYDEVLFNKIRADYESFSSALGFETLCAIPTSARYGENVATLSKRTGWYSGPTLLRHLETVVTERMQAESPFRFPVQYVSRPNASFRGFAGQVASGSISVGDPVVVAKSGQLSKVKTIVTFDEELATAVDGQGVTIVLEDQVEVSRGNMLVSPGARPHVTDQFQAHIVWFDANSLIPGRSYLLKTENDSTEATITALKYAIDINRFVQRAAKTLCMNEVGVCNISTQAPLAFDTYAENRATGNFILIDRLTNSTLGAGMIDHPLRRAQNIHWQSLEIGRALRAKLLRQSPTVIWFTGLSGSGKSTVANHLEKLLYSKGRYTYILDGDNIRHGLNRDLGFTDEDRVENIRRVAEVAKLMADAGLIVIVSFISPFRSERSLAREMMEDGEFIEVFVDTPLEECVRRDPKGLYRKALRGEIANFTGISSDYEPPQNPDLHLKTLTAGPDDLAMEISDWLYSNGRM